jgi:hypothetical protein
MQKTAKTKHSYAIAKGCLRIPQIFGVAIHIYMLSLHRIKGLLEIYAVIVLRSPLLCIDQLGLNTVAHIRQIVS